MVSLLFQLKAELEKNADKKQAKILQKFFKTGKGDYGEGDIFLGIKVPLQRHISKKYKQLNFLELQQLLNSKVHEHRFIAILILIDKYDSSKDKKKIFEFYTKNYRNINNWDLVDLSAPKIYGNYLLNKNRKILYEFAKSENLWKKRIAIVSTYTFIKKKDFEDTLKISKILLNDKHDLIHKAVGWMLRVVGKHNIAVEEKFLKKHHEKMPRTMLRYAIEKFPEHKRRFYMQKKSL